MNPELTVINLLDPLGYPVFQDDYPGKSTTYITFFFYHESAAYCADNEEKRTGYYVQVDVWSHDGELLSIIRDQVKSTLLESGFIRKGIVPGEYDDSTQTYHKGMRFYFV
ncbi:hypothetical protein [Priestia aryabhattai]|uniref:hypothetical protein n=1 Tax=Priestia aryabhattai TaxID=412384 RepID=UPI002E1F1370|nr:hypothetical protein [Priestia aryabhattai]MED4262175.1 hypothetical protein [Priestia aryabhattai]